MKNLHPLAEKTARWCGMTSNMYDLSGQAVLSTKGYRLELWRMEFSRFKENSQLLLEYFLHEIIFTKQERKDV